MLLSARSHVCERLASAIHTKNSAVSLPAALSQYQPDAAEPESAELSADIAPRAEH